MAKYKCYFEWGEHDGNKEYFHTASTKKEAIEHCAKKVCSVGYSDEKKIAEASLDQRGYYCCGYSDREVGFEEVE